MSKLSKISKISKFPKLTKIPNHSCIIIFFPFFFLLAPNVIVPVVLWAEACPFASSSTAVPVHHGTEHLMCTKISNLFLKWGGVSKWVLWGRTVLGVMPPVHDQGPVCPDHVAASAWLPVSWLCRFGCPPVQWCSVGRSPPCVGSIPEQWMITPNTPGMV